MRRPVQARQYPKRQQRERAQAEAMEVRGYLVIRFGHQEDWAAKNARYPYIFGKEQR